MVDEPGLRARKKLRTRESIAAAAFELFAANGFEAVPVAAVARHAEVSEATVFNYFATKEDLIFDPLQEFETALVNAVRARTPDQSVAAAFGGFLLARNGLLGSARPEDSARLVAVSRIINDSPALRARERQVYDDFARVLAGFLAEEAGVSAGDIRPWVVANALLGVQRALVDFVRSEVLAGRAGPALARRVRTQAQSALATLERGLGRL